MNAFVDITQYEIIKRIHTSNFARTMLALDKKSEKKKIIKTLFYVLNTSSSQSHFLEYVNELKSIVYPTLLPYKLFSFDIKSQFHPSVILDYYPNGSLYECCKILNNTQKTIVIIGIVEGMRYLHHNGKYHGCLEPGNIILDDNLHPIISSYGLSELSEKIKFDVFRCPFTLPYFYSSFKYNYINIREEYDELKMRQADDVFAFAMLLYFILKNETPFQNQCETWQQRIQMFIQGFRPQLPSWVPCDLAKLENECWLADATERPTFKEISHRLKTCTAILPPGVDVRQINEYIESIGDPEEKNQKSNQTLSDVQNQKSNQTPSDIQNQKSNQTPSDVQNQKSNQTPSDVQNQKSNQDQSQSQSPVWSQNQNKSQSQSQNSNAAHTQELNTPNIQGTNIKKRRIFLKYQRPAESQPIMPQNEKSYEDAMHTKSNDFNSSKSDNSDEKDMTLNTSKLIDEKEVKSDHSQIDLDSNKSDHSEKNLGSYYYLFSDVSDQNEKSDSDSAFKTKLVPQSQNYSSPQTSKLKYSSDSTSDSESIFSSAFSSESNSEEKVSDDEESIIAKIPVENLEKLKQQTKEGKSLILSGRYDEGTNLIKEAADSLYRGAILAYGCLLECGVGVKQDLKQAAAYYRKALKMGSTNAKAAYSRFAMKGLGGVEHNSQAAINLLSKAANDQLLKYQKKPNIPIRSDMKVSKRRKFYEEDVEIIKNPHQNIFPAKTEALYQYAEILKKNGKNDDEKLEESLKYAQPAAEKDHNINAMNLYGELIQELGKTKQYPKMAKFFKIAADEGHSMAQFNYGNCRKEGLGVTENIDEAVRYYKMSADQENPYGLNQYGIALQDGIGIPQNIQEAKKYIKMAADLGNEDAQFNYVMLLQLKIGVNVDNPEEDQKAEREYREYLKKASDLDIPEAMIMYSKTILSDLEENKLDENKKIESLKTAKFYLKRILEKSQDEAPLEEAENLLAVVKQKIKENSSIVMD